MIQWPIAFWRTRSFIKAFFEPNNFMANLLSVGAKMFWSWFLTQPGLDSLETEFLEIFIVKTILWTRTMVHQSWKATWMYWLFPLPPWVFRTGRHRPSPCQCGCWNAPCYRAHRTPYIPAAVQVIVCGKLMLFCQSVFHFDTNSLVWQRLYLVIH